MDCSSGSAHLCAPGTNAPVGWPDWPAPLEQPPEGSLCVTCPVRGRCIGGLAAQAGTRQLLGVLAGRRSLRAGDTLDRQDQSTPSVYALRSGSLKSVARLDGVERLRGVHFPGELVGAMGLTSGRPGVALVAMEDTQVCVLRSEAPGTPGNRAYLGRVWDMLSRELLRERAHASWLAGLQPELRVAAFLASLSARARAGGSRSGAFLRHLSGADIAGYLEVSTATVERVLFAQALQPEV
jgi:CRP/FNR family transcriptional regulator